MCHWNCYKMNSYTEWLTISWTHTTIIFFINSITIHFIQKNIFLVYILCTNVLMISIQLDNEYGGTLPHSSPKSIQRKKPVEYAPAKFSRLKIGMIMPPHTISAHISQPHWEVVYATSAPSINTVQQKPPVVMRLIYLKSIKYPLIIFPLQL